MGAEVVGGVAVIAWLFRLFLLLEMAVYVALAFCWVREGLGGGAIAGRLLVIGLLWRFSHGFVTWCVAQGLRWRDGRPLDWRNQCIALGKEIAARVVSFNWSQPFPALAMRGNPVGRRGGRPILLVHGFFSNRGIWHRMRGQLLARGLGPIHLMELSPVFAAVSSMADSLHRQIESIRRESGAAQIDLVVHSMGGLVSRQYFREHGTGAIAHFVSIGSPHHGTRVAKMALFRCVFDMQRGGGFLADLADYETQHPPKVDALSIYSLNDDLVYPPETSELSWAENRALQGVGHVSLCFDERVVEMVARWVGLSAR